MKTDTAVQLLIVSLFAAAMALPDGFIPWAKLRRGRNLLAITLTGDTAK